MEHYIELKANIHSLRGNRGVSSNVKTFFGSNWLLSVELMDNGKLKQSLHREINYDIDEAPVEPLAKIGPVKQKGKFDYDAVTVKSDYHELVYKKNIIELIKEGSVVNDQLTVRCEVRDRASEDRCISMIAEAPPVGEGDLMPGDEKCIDGYQWHIRVAVTGNEELKICISREKDRNVRWGLTYSDSIIRVGLIDVNGVFYLIEPVTNVLKFDWIKPGLLPDLRQQGLIKGNWIAVKCEFGRIQIEKNGKNVGMNLDASLDAFFEGVNIRSEKLMHEDHLWFLKGELRGSEFRVRITCETSQGTSPYDGPIDLGFVNLESGEFFPQRATMTAASEFSWTFPGTIEDMERVGYIKDRSITFRCEFEKNEWPNNVFIPHGRS